jgi:hypothetical protein
VLFAARHRLCIIIIIIIIITTTIIFYFMYRVCQVLGGASRLYIERSVSPGDDNYVFCLQ